MCGLCGLLGADMHWTDGTVTRADDAARTRRQERLTRVALVNRLLGRYRLKLSDWQGTAYVLTSGTGRTEIVPDLTALWRAAETISGRKFDPLDPDLLAGLPPVVQD